MKWFFIGISALVVIFFSFQIYWSSVTSEIEEYPYQVIEDFDEFSIRQYESRLFISVSMKENVYKKSSREGFSTLAGYIFGGNSKNEKIAMTSPVSISLQDTMTMMFIIPKKYKKENLPKPNVSEIEFKEEKIKRVAVVQFGGWASSEKIELEKKKLKKLLNEQNITHSNKFYFLGYNPPFEVFNRKNEIIVELQTKN